MTKQELEKYLEIETVLNHYKLSVDEDGFMSCPFHTNCKKGLKLYKELNGVACTRESCANYRKIYNAFEFLQEIKGVKVEEARMYGKALLLKELEQLRELKQEDSFEEIEEKRSLSRSEKGLILYWKKLKGFVLMQGSGNKAFEFNLTEVREQLGVSKTSQQRYIHELIAKKYIKQSSGSVNTGYYYQIMKWE
jgi:hypothetical protein